MVGDPHHHHHRRRGDGGLGDDALDGGVEHNPHCLQDQHDCQPMALGGLDVEVDHDDDAGCPHGGVGDPSYHLELESLVDGDLDVVDGVRLLEGASLLDDVGLGVGDGPSSLVDEAARGVGLDHPRLELCFLRWNDVKTLSLIARSAGVVFREAIPRDEWNAHCSHVGRLVFERSAHCSRVGRLVYERNAQCFHVARRDGAPHSGVSCRRCTS